MLTRIIKYVAVSLVGMVMVATATCDPVTLIQHEIEAGRLAQDVALIGVIAGGLGT